MILRPVLCDSDQDTIAYHNIWYYNTIFLFEQLLIKFIYEKIIAYSCMFMMQIFTINKFTNIHISSWKFGMVKKNPTNWKTVLYINVYDE